MKYVSIQYLRAVAALMVVFHHARNPAPWLYDPLASFGVGQAGVDIFFVISGFIMYSAARSEAVLEFAKRRVLRIAPLYWLATLLLVALTIAHTRFDATFWVHLLQSLLFIPHYSPQFPNEIWPYLVPGWTLNFEAFFYVVFAVGLFTRRLMLTCSFLLGAAVIAGLALRSNNALWLTYTNPLLLEFLAGMAIARFGDRLSGRGWAAFLPIGVALLVVSHLWALPRVLSWGAPAVALVIGALAFERAGWAPKSRFLLLLGDGSYAIYLFQSVVVAAVYKLVQRLPLQGPVQFAALLAGCLLGVCVVGVAVHLLVEKPMLRRLLRARPPARADVLAAP